MTQRRNYSDDYDLYTPVEDTEDFGSTKGRRKRWRTDDVYDEAVTPRWL